ncbi:UNKNOWN [Stylonychia lemnae]|uniref:Uncharacterized protein n=1 Tax=Stylonychia lemnae TaxID=5949 RepID=A0A078AHJ7_STYLE|nr:UNKNOWN [Stylonychia lemnae]|eukprot:CDW81755.1 UNKNOWN [Stylonychia lemnae]
MIPNYNFEYNNLRSLTKDELIDENLKLQELLDKTEDELLDLAQTLAISNENLQLEYHKQSKNQDDMKKSQLRILKLEQKIQQELKDKDLIMQDMAKLNVQRDQYIKDAKQMFTKQVSISNNGGSEEIIQKQKANQVKKNSKKNPYQTNLAGVIQGHQNGKNENVLFQQSEDAFKELMSSSYSKQYDKKAGKNKNSNEKEEQKQEDEFGLSGIKYDSLFS